MPRRIKKYTGNLIPGFGPLFNAEGDTGGGGAPAGGEGNEAGKSGETPEQTIEALRAALAKANDEAKTQRFKAKESATLQAELDKLRQANESGDDKAKREAEQAITKARDEAATAARAEVMAERVMDKIELAAKGKFTDINDALINLEKQAADFIKDGAIDTDAITKAVDKLLEDKPHYAANTKTPVPPPGRAGIGTGSTSASDAVKPGLSRLRNAYAQTTSPK